MAQRDKVKELVGRGLNSYHTKALQQMDRIEKKNKEQNHKISILSNELDNDYLTKTEEGSVISLEHSKEGMVYLDELQGNTLVNYCTDGSKEMTLNGDIDVEGTFVTTTEGVDNGKVDVICEGNTLVNLFKDWAVENPSWLQGNLTQEITGRNITVCNLSNKKIRFQTSKLDGSFGSQYIVNEFSKTALTIPSDRKKRMIQGHFEDGWTANDLNVFKNSLIILEGDWTNKEVPTSMFWGMQSVGQDDVSGHKIEILSHNKFLGMNDDNITLRSSSSRQGFNKFTIIGSESWNSEVHFNVNSSDVPIGTNIKIRIKVLENTNPSMNNSSLKSWQLTDFNVGNFDYSLLNEWQEVEYNVNKEYTGSANSKLNLMIFGLKNTALPTDRMVAEIEVEINNSKKSNKKEILMNEPLRAIDNVKDRIVKIDGKYFIERNTKQIIIDNNTPLQNSTIEGQETCKKFMIGLEVFSDRYVCNAFDSFAICDTLPTLIQSERTKDVEFVSPDGWNINMFFSIKRSKLQGDTVADIKTYLQQNPMKLVYRLATPIYEPLEVEPTLSTYNDITHISNNSIIPCNMKIKNTGYNAIIKPSTLYTVAIGTNKGGTVGVNLGGTKGTTTNNALKLTTPATLSDDSLRIYGKGLKGSKVRLFEGDIINIPKHFTGMQSSFEDKVQTDGSYKVEVLSNNENLFRLEDIKYSTSAGNSARPIKNGFKIITDTVNYWHAVVSMELNVKPKTTYTLGVSKKVVINAYPSQEPSWGAGYVFIREYGDKVLTEGKVKDNTRTYFRFNSGENTKIRVTFATATDVATQKGEYDFTDLDLRESKSNLEYVDNKYNKIQFSSIEPLRKWDRFVFKDGQLMIERGSKKVDLGVEWSSKQQLNTGIYRYTLNNVEGIYSMAETICNTITTVTLDDISDKVLKYFNNAIWYQTYNDFTLEELREYFTNSNTSLIFKLKEPTYEEIPHELQKIILEGYENGTLFFDTNIPPTSTVTYAGETPIVKSVKLNKTEVLNNTNDINDNIIPYLMDMDYRVVMLQLATEELEGGVSMARLFGGTYEMIKRDILSKRLTREEYGYRLADYFNAGKLTEEQVRELEDLR